MENTERRTARRCPLHYPVMLNRNQREHCLASILDVGHKGLRVRISSPADIAVGQKIEVTSSRKNGGGKHGARLNCRVVWENRDLDEVGLEYLSPEN